MLTPDQITALRDISGQLMDPVVEFLIEDIARRVSEAGQLTSTAAYEVWRAQNLGISQKQLKKEIEKRLKISQEQVEQLMTQAAEAGYDFDISRFPTVDAIPFADNTSLQQVLDAAIKLAQKDLTNITQTMGFVTAAGKVEDLTKAYRSACDFAFQKVVLGAQDYNSAVRDATRGLAQKGIRFIDYASGTHTSVEAAVRRNIMSGLGLLDEQITQQNHDDLGCDGWEISAHGCCAPDHEPIQGRQYSDKVYTRLNNSLVRRIGTLNCGHTAMPIILGVNEPQYTKEELEDFRRQNEAGVTYDGKHYTLYEATQRQRRLETSIRNRKHRILIDEQLGDKDALQNDQIRLQLLKQEYTKFSKAAKLPMQYERMEAAGFTWKQGKAAEKAAKQAQKRKIGNVKNRDTAQVFKLNSQYRNSNGAFNIQDAKHDYDEFLTKAPEKNRILLKQSLDSVEYEQTKLQSAPFGYSHKKDKVLFDPSRSDFWDIEFAVANTHELAHRIDNFFVQSESAKEFSAAIANAREIIDANPSRFVEYSMKNDEQGFVSDIFSAISGGKYHFMAGHDAEYWNEPGSKEREIFANLFSMETFRDTEKLGFLRTNFTELFKAFEKLEY